MKWIKCFILICFIIFLTGCWDRRELSEVSLVTGMAVDKGDTLKYKLTIETTEAREMNYQTATGFAPSFVYSIEGNTIGELAYKLNVAASARPIYSHMRLLAISEEVAEKGMLDFMDFLDRNREIRDDFSIVIVRGKSAGDLMKITSMYKKSPSLKLFTQLMTMQKDWGGAPDIKLNDYIRIYNAKGQSPVLAAVNLVGDPKKGGNVENLKSEDPESEVWVDSMAIIKTGKLIGYASLNEVRDMLFVQNKIKSTAITSSCKTGKFEYRVTHNRSKVTAKEIKGVPTFHIKIKAEGNLEGTECMEEFRKPNTFEKLEASVNKKMEKEIKEFVKKTQEEFNADIFGFGEFLRKQDYKHFKKYKDNWDKEYAKAEIHVHFNTEIKRAGLKKESYTPK